MEKRQRLKLFDIPREEIPYGVSFHAGKSIIVFRAENDRIKATRNVCRHQGGSFVPTKKNGSCLLRCPHHGWILDVENMEYTNPSGGLRQNELIIEEFADCISITEEGPHRAWKKGEIEPQVLHANEWTLRFFAHACAEIIAGSQRIFTDPWLVGPAFARGWWLVHTPPSDWLDSLAKADAIYISHNHSDHLNTYTLRELQKRNPEVLMIAPGFASRSVELPLRTLGFTNIKVVEFGVWEMLDSNTKLMVLADAAGRDDSGLLLDYKGHSLLNTVDCANLNDGNLPEKVDVLLSSFASGASGFPVCWEEMYSPQKISSIVEKNRALSMKHFVDTAKMVQPRIAIPFAGYFREAHPNDHLIERMNIKNTPNAVRERMAKEGLDAFVWIPRSGGTIDCGGPNKIDPDITAPVPRTLESFEFEKYVSLIEDDARCPALSTMEGVVKYFEWAGYRANHVLHVIETDDTFSNVM